MVHFAKLGGVLGLAAFLAGPAPASAAARHAGFAFRPHAAISANRHADRFDRRRKSSRFGGDGLFDDGYIGGFGVPLATPTPDYPVAPEPYPVNYYGLSDTPTGYGVVYNSPPPRPALWVPGPRIIYLSGRHFHHRRHRHFCARGHGVTMVRGGYVTVE